MFICIILHLNSLILFLFKCLNLNFYELVITITQLTFVLINKSLIYRYTYMDNKVGKYEIPLTHGLQIRVVLGGLVSGTCRALIETPLEFAKVFLK